MLVDDIAAIAHARMGTRTRFASVVSRKHSSSATFAGLKRTVSQRFPTTKEAARREALLALAPS